MSATGRGTIRNAADFYPTPGWCVHRLLEKFVPTGNRWLEPAVGGGSIVNAVEDVIKPINWTLNDLHSHPINATLHPRPHYNLDFLTDPIFDRAWYTMTPFDVCITNPPYSLAMQFIERSLQIAYQTVMLLRLNFLEGEKRAAFFHANTPSIYVLPNRPSFTGHGTDACAYAWFVWSKGGVCGSTVEVLNTTPVAQR